MAYAHWQNRGQAEWGAGWNASGWQRTEWDNWRAPGQAAWQDTRRDGWNAAGWRTGWNGRNAAGETTGQGRQIRRNICKHWEAGGCMNGDECNFAHGEEMLGTRQGEPPAGQAYLIDVDLSQMASDDEKLEEVAHAVWTWIKGVPGQSLPCANLDDFYNCNVKYNQKELGITCKPDELCGAFPHLFRLVVEDRRQTIFALDPQPAPRQRRIVMFADYEQLIPVADGLRTFILNEPDRKMIWTDFEARFLQENPDLRTAYLDVKRRTANVDVKRRFPLLTDFELCRIFKDKFTSFQKDKDSDRYIHACLSITEVAEAVGNGTATEREVQAWKKFELMALDIWGYVIRNAAGGVEMSISSDSMPFFWKEYGKHKDTRKLFGSAGVKDICDKFPNLLHYKTKNWAGTVLALNMPSRAPAQPATLAELRMMAEAFRGFILENGGAISGDLVAEFWKRHQQRDWQRIMAATDPAILVGAGKRSLRDTELKVRHFCECFRDLRLRFEPTPRAQSGPGTFHADPLDEAQ